MYFAKSHSLAPLIINWEEGLSYLTVADCSNFALSQAPLLTLLVAGDCIACTWERLPCPRHEMPAGIALPVFLPPEQMVHSPSKIMASCWTADFNTCMWSSSFYSKVTPKAEIVTSTMKSSAFRSTFGGFFSGLELAISSARPSYSSWKKKTTAQPVFLHYQVKT